MISLKDQLRKSLLEVCPPEDLRQWFDPLQLRLESDEPEKEPLVYGKSVNSIMGVEPHNELQTSETETDQVQADQVQADQVQVDQVQADQVQIGEHQSDEQLQNVQSGAENNIIEPIRYTLVVTLPHGLFAEWFAKKGQDVFESTVALLSTRGSENEENDRLLSIRYEAPQDATLLESISGKGRQANLLSGVLSGVLISPIASPLASLKSRKDQSTQPQKSFDDYVTNAKHKQTLHVLRSLLPRNPRAVNPVVLCGPAGSGKTHLLEATAARLNQTLGSGMVVHNAETLDSQSLNGPLKSLLMDNLHRLSPEPVVQAAFIRRLDATLNEGHPVLLAGLGRPAEWQLAEELRSRLHSGVILSLPEADMDMCLRFAQQRFKTAGIRVEKEALLQLVRRFPDIRRLTGVLRRMEALNAPGQDVDLEQVLAQSDAPGLTPQAIIQICAEALDVNPKDILSSKRKPKLVRARQLSMFLCRELLGHSYPTIGQHFGGKDHSSVIHAVRKMKELQASDTDTNILVTEVTKSCKKLVE